MLYHFAFATVEPDIDNTRTPSYQPCASHFYKVALALMGEAYWSVVVVLDCRLYSVQVYRRSGSLHYFQPRPQTPNPRKAASQPAESVASQRQLCYTGYYSIVASRTDWTGRGIGMDMDDINAHDPIFEQFLR